MIIKLEPQSEVAIYIQLMNQIIVGVANGNLKSGDALPSVRSLAADLGINMHTVNKSYHELEKKGIIRIVPKSGAVINPISEMKINIDEVSDKMNPLIAEAVLSGISKDEIKGLVEEILKEFTL